MKRAPKANRKRKTFEVPGPSAPGAMPMDQRASIIFSYFKSYNYKVRDLSDLVIWLDLSGGFLHNLDLIWTPDSTGRLGICSARESSRCQCLQQPLRSSASCGTPAPLLTPRSLRPHMCDTPPFHR